MKFRVTTSEVVIKVLELEADSKEEATETLASLFRELVSVKTINYEITDVEEIE